jgi:hypothetical protein
MRTVHSKHALPRCWRKHPACKGLVLEQDIAVSPRSRLRAKLLVFDGTRSLKQFCNRALNDKGGWFDGMVHPCSYTLEQVGKDGTSHVFDVVDKKYFCIIGLAKTRLSTNVVCHESCHVGFRYADRVKRAGLWPGDWEVQEERVCFPAGRVFAEINKVLHEANLWK